MKELTIKSNWDGNEISVSKDGDGLGFYVEGPGYDQFVSIDLDKEESLRIYNFIKEALGI